MTDAGPDIDALAAEAAELYAAVADRADESQARRFTWHTRRFRGKTGRDVVAAGVTPELARDVVASQEAFDSWSGLAAYADRLRAEPDGDAAAFERAARAVVDGDADGLRSRLKSHDGLAAAASPRRHGGSLWHYLAANGVEDSAQRTPANAVEIAGVLRQAGGGASVDRPCDVYGGGPGSTPLVALVTSGHPANAGVQADLAREFVAAGSDPDGVDGAGDPLRCALGFRYVPAAFALVECGASVRDLPTAAAVGDVGPFLDGRCVSASCEFPNPAGDGLPESRPPHGPAVLQQALVFACMADRWPVAERLLDAGASPDGGPRRDIGPIHEAAFQGHAETVRRLVDRGADPWLRDAMWDSTAAGWASANGHDTLIDWLLSLPDADMADAVELDRPAVVARLLASREWSPEELTPRLRDAAALGLDGICDQLRAAEADPLAANELGLAAADYAERRGHVALATRLRRA